MFFKFFSYKLIIYQMATSLSLEVKDLLLNGNPEILQWEEDEIALRAATANARLPWDDLSELEQKLFPDVINDLALKNMYFYIRNKILQIWNENPNVEATVDFIAKQLEYPYNTCRLMLKRVYAFLNRHGFINFGRYCRLTNSPKLKHRVLIIGAGAAGLAAFSQLDCFGFDVTVLEARDRIGGRIASVIERRTTGCSGELGATHIMGFVGNPLWALTRQHACILNAISERELIFDEKGQLLNEHIDRIATDLYNKLMACTSFLATAKQITSVADQPLSFEDVHHILLKLVGLRQKRRFQKVWETYQEICEKRLQLFEEQALLKKSCQILHAKLHQLERKQKSGLTEEEELIQEITIRCYRNDIADAVKKFDELRKKIKNVEEKILNLKQLENREEVIGKIHRQLIDHNYAVLEFGTGAPLNCQSLLHWNHDESNVFKGSWVTIKEGLRELFRPLARTNSTNRILYKHVVREIKYDSNGCTVIVDDHNDGEVIRREFRADAVICTIPIGVLKKSVAKEETAPKFSPELPDVKVEAINGIGAGLVNKVMMVFEKPFWENQIQHFGHFGALGKSERSRGEFFSFLVANDTPTLVGLLSGDSAKLTTQLTPEQLTARAMTILQKIFGSITPKEPLAVHLSKWHDDPYASCAFSYMSKNSKPEYYDDLAEPVLVKDHDSEKPMIPRICFAGEHTSRDYPATVHGAFLTGLREAARLADYFLGPLNTGEQPAECVTLDSDEDEKEDVTPMEE